MVGVGAVAITGARTSWRSYGRGDERQQRTTLPRELLSTIRRGNIAVTGGPPWHGSNWRRRIPRILAAWRIISNQLVGVFPTPTPPPITILSLPQEGALNR